MRVTIESTEHFTTVNGAQCRAWKGTGEDGAPFVMLIAAVSTTEKASAAFASELMGIATPIEMLAMPALLFLLFDEE